MRRQCTSLYGSADDDDDDWKPGWTRGSQEEPESLVDVSRKKCATLPLSAAPAV